VCYNYGRKEHPLDLLCLVKILVLEEPSLREKEKHHVQTKSIYLNRAFGRDCHYRIIDGDIDAGDAAGEETGQGGSLSGKPAPVGDRLFHVHGSEQRLLPQRTGRRRGQHRQVLVDGTSQAVL